MRKKWAMFFSVLSVTAGISLSSGAARAGEICDTVAACRALQAALDARLLMLLDNAPNLTDVASDTDRMNQFDAYWYCQHLGQRLPTARELAIYAQSLGAQGISETAKDGYDLIKGSDTTGYPDHFYFSSKGYHRPAGDTGIRFFWSSSADPILTRVAYGLYSDSGNIGTGNRSDNLHGASSVRCTQSR